jgi:hypothetical protein
MTFVQSACRLEAEVDIADHELDVLIVDYRTQKIDLSAQGSKGAFKNCHSYDY